tara:strand:- start:3340 stop:3912 length:573 start_codon:yes stop_codon:yes gene_type:complete
MFDSDRQNADITLCIFPHLREFIAVDARETSTNGPTVLTLSISNILGEDFYYTIERDFSKLIRRKDMGFLELMAIPQKIEALVRSNSLQRIIAELGIDKTDDSHNANDMVGVLFFAGSLLEFENSQLEEATRELFGKKLPVEILEQLNDQLKKLMGQERLALQRATRQDLSGLISGTSGAYVTLWENSGN